MAMQHRGTVAVPEAAERLGISRIYAYEAIKRGTFPVPVIKIGRRIVVPLEPLERLLAGQT